MTAEITAAWELGAALLPMTDDRVRHPHHRDDATAGVDELAMQEWFVRRALRAAGASRALRRRRRRAPGPGVLDALARRRHDRDLPANPVISIGPILAVPGMRDALVAAARPCRRA